MAHPLTAATSPHDSVAVLLQQLECEVVRVREHPLPARLQPICGLPKSTWGRLAVGDPLHVFVQARSAKEIQDQHVPAVENGFGALNKTPVVCLRLRESDQSPQQNASLSIVTLDSSAELKELRKETKSVPAYGLLSSSLNVSQSWMNEWLDDSILWVTKIDHSLHTFLTQHCSQQEQIRYSPATLRDGKRTLNSICFLTRKKEEEHWGLFVGFCGLHTVKTCVQYIEEKMDSARMVYDPEPFENDLFPVLQTIGTHMLRDELYFSFNQFAYS